MSLKKWITATLSVLLILAITVTAHALTVRQKNNAALKAAWTYLQTDYPDSIKLKHRVLILSGDERLVLINFKSQTSVEPMFCALHISAETVILWDSTLRVYDDAKAFFISKNGDCFHISPNCCGMKDPLWLSKDAVNLVFDALRPCQRCNPLSQTE